MATYFTSNSHYACWQFCPRKRWLQYHYKGKGIVPTKVDTPLAFGSAVHQGLQSVLLEEPVGDFAAEMDNPMWQWVAECLVEAWRVSVAPSLFDRYDLVSSEQELSRQIKGTDLEIIRGDKLDAILRDKQTQELVGLEFKTTGVLDQRYLESWHYSAQPVAHARAIEKQYEEPCRKIRMEFLFKGKMSKEGRLYSPFGACWTKHGSPPIPYEDYAHTKRMKASGFDWANPWELGLTADAWVRDCGGGVGSLGTVDVYPSTDMIDQWERTMEFCERSVAKRLELSDPERWDPTFFPGLLSSSCKSGLYFKTCEYLEICWNGVHPETAVDDGLFQQRTSHYQLEEDLEEA